MRFASSFLLMGLAVACGSRTPLGTGTRGSDELSFPTGTFFRCTEGVHGSEPNLFLNGLGFAKDGSLTVTANGANLHATYLDLDGKETELDFRAVTNRTAVGVAGQTLDGFTGLCVEGIGVNHQRPFAATMQVSHATLTYSGGAMFLAASGVVSGDGGSCGTLSETATRWVVCSNGPLVADAPAPPPVKTTLASAPTCTAQIGTYYETGGMQQILSSGGDGEQLSVVPSASAIGASASGTWLSSTLELRAETTTLAAAVVGPQRASTPCQVPIETHASDKTPADLDLNGAVLDGEGTETLLLFHGTMAASSSCAGAEKAGVLFCAKP